MYQTVSLSSQRRSEFTLADMNCRSKEHLPFMRFTRYEGRKMQMLPKENVSILTLQKKKKFLVVSLFNPKPEQLRVNFLSQPQIK